jgi:hypothetical protein
MAKQSKLSTDILDALEALQEAFKKNDDLPTTDTGGYFMGNRFEIDKQGKSRWIL